MRTIELGNNFGVVCARTGSEAYRRIENEISELNLTEMSKEELVVMMGVLVSDAYIFGYIEGTTRFV